MKKLTVALMVISLVLAGVAVAAAADQSAPGKELKVTGFQKINDKQASEIRAQGLGSGFGGYGGDCPNLTTVCVPNNYLKSNNYNYLTPGSKR
jgi:hypothetical protein